MSSTRTGRPSRRATTAIDPTTPAQRKRKSVGDILSEDSTAPQSSSRRVRSKSQPGPSTQAQQPWPPRRSSKRPPPLPKAPAKSAPSASVPDQGYQQQQPLSPMPLAEYCNGPMTAPNPDSTFQDMMEAPPLLDPRFELQEPLPVPYPTPPFQTAFDSSSSSSSHTSPHPSQPRQEAEEEGEKNKDDENADDEDSEASTPSPSPLPYSRPTASGPDESSSDCGNPTPTPGSSSAPRIVKPKPRRPYDANALDIPPSGSSMAEPDPNANFGPTSSESSLLQSKGIGSSSPTLKRKLGRQTYSSLQEAADDPSGPEELKAIHEFFNMTPPKIIKGKDHTKSPATRVPQRYDRHLDHRITLKGVVYCPEMGSDLLNLAETTALRRWDKNDIPAMSSKDDFPRPERRRGLKKPGSRTVTEEAGVVDFYNNWSTHVATVATTLYFGRCMWKSDILKFDRVSTGQGRDAIADGYLRVDLALADGVAADQSVDHLEAEILQGQKLLLWEFKSLTVGNIKVMAAIMELAGHPFDWEYCEYGLLSDRCRDEHKPTQDDETDGEIHMHKREPGPQATGPEAESIWPQSFGVCDDTRQWNELVPDLEEEEEDKEDKHKDKGKEKKEEKEKKEKEKNSQHAKWVVQQASVWAQLVKNDVTLAVISSGKFEIYCRRDRIRNTLSLSNLVIVDECKVYGQLQVGLYLAALGDAKIRFTLAREQPISVQPGPAKLTSSEILDKARKRDKLVLTFQPKVTRCRRRDTKCYKEDTPYIRHQEKTESETSEDENERIRVQVTLQISDSVFLGNLSVGTSMFKGTENFDGKIIIKISDDKDSNDKLENEYDAYNKLHKKGSTEGLVPAVIGVFRFKRHKGSDFLAMLLQNVGVDLDQLIWRTSDSQLPQVADLREPFLCALQAIHDAEVLHGAIGRHHHLIWRATKKTPKKVKLTPVDGKSKEDKGRKRGKKFEVITVLDHQVAFVSFGTVKATYTKEGEMSILKSLFPDEQGFTSPPIPRGNSASPDGAEKRPRLEAYDYTGRAWT